MTGEPIKIDADAFYTDNALALAGLSDTSIAKARRAGLLRHTRRGGRIMYRGSWIIAWLTGDQERQGAELQGAIAC